MTSLVDRPVVGTGSVESVPDNGLDNCIVDRPGGIRRLNRRVFTDPAWFNLEFKLIWEKIWVYVAHESQIPRPNDYLTTHIGRQPIVVNRNRKGEIGAFINACAHRGASVCRLGRGNAAAYVCPFHGWVYDSDGKLLDVKDEADGAYPPAFDKKALGLTRLARVESYGGFIFASLNPDAEPLADHLGGVRVFIDMLVEQAPDGIEVLRGASTYTYNGNWKLQAENGVDGYHVGSVHANYVATLKHRAASNSVGEKTKTMDVGRVKAGEGGFYDLGHGHTLLWSDWPNPQDRPNYPQYGRYMQRFGKEWADWMVGRLRNLLIYPNVFLMDQMATQIRVFRPLAVDKTEVTIYCFAPKGEDPDARRRRIRQYEDFFNASGMATPDDLSEFNAVQFGAMGEAAPWSDLSRGALREKPGPDALARELHLDPALTGGRLEDEGLLIGQHKRWLDLMRPGLEETQRG